MLVDSVRGEPAVLSAQVESKGVVVRPFRRTVGGSPACDAREAAAGTIDKFIHRAKVDRPIGDAILQGGFPTAILGVAAAGHRAVIADVRKAIATADRIVLEHRICAE